MGKSNPVISTADKKRAFRAQIRAARLQLSSEEVQNKSRIICERAIGAIMWSRIRNLHCFTSIKEAKEVDTADIFEYAWQNFPNVTTYTTLMVGKEWKAGRATEGLFAETFTALPKFDVIIVPMLAFDAKLNRLGYGKGYYDRFLATQPQAVKIGLCFELGHLPSLPIEPHDVPMNIIITEKLLKPQVR
ncbi:5-formyltetrahydrofolate cyclo-ligase [soil metagenome]